MEAYVLGSKIFSAAAMQAAPFGAQWSTVCLADGCSR